ncbi:hypothetical protein [Burkholderia ubonensis]|nr:hypothetical protein [Burkholderia ubonensis]
MSTHPARRTDANLLMGNPSNELSCLKAQRVSGELRRLHDSEHREVSDRA